MKGIRVVSDGTPLGTKVYDEDGADLTKRLRIRSISWRQVAFEGPVVMLECFPGSVDIAGAVEEKKVEIFMRPECIFNYCPNSDRCNVECVSPSKEPAEKEDLKNEQG